MDSNKRNSGGLGLVDEIGNAAFLTEAEKSNVHGLPALAVAASIDSGRDVVAAEIGNVGSSAVIGDERPILQGRGGEPETMIAIHDQKGEHVLTALTEAGAVPEPFALNVGIPASSKSAIDTVFDNAGAVGEFVNGEHEFKVSGLGIASEPSVLTAGDTEPILKPLISSAFDDYGTPVYIRNGGRSDDATPRLEGTRAQPYEQLEIYDGSTRLGYADADGSGNWSFDVTGALALGEHAFTVIGAGAASDAFVLNITAPFKPVIDLAVDDFGSSTVVVSGGTTDDDTPQLQGSGAEPYARVELYDGSTLVDYDFADRNGNWRVSVQNSLAPGEHSFTVVNAGLTSEAFVLNIIAPDFSKPVIDSAFDNFNNTGNVANGGTTDDTTPQLQGKGAQPNTQLEVYDGSTRLGYADVDYGGNWTFSVNSALALGEHAFTVVGAGGTSDVFVLNIAAPDSAKPVIDSAIDDFGSSAIVANGGNTDDTTPQLRGKSEQTYAQLEVYDGSRLLGYAFVDGNGDWTFNVRGALALGEHAFTVVGAGGTSDAFVLNITAPAPAKPSVIDSVFDDFGSSGVVANGGNTDDATPQLQGKSGQIYGQLEVYDGSTRLGYAFVDGNGDWTFNVKSALAAGEHVFTVVGAGGTSDAFVLNITAPDSAKPVIDSAVDDFGSSAIVANGGHIDDATPQLQGKGVPPYAQLEVYDGKTFLGYTNPADGNGDWTFNVRSALAVGEHVFTVVGAGVASDTFVLHIMASDSPTSEIYSAIDDVGTPAYVGNDGNTTDTTPRLLGKGAQPYAQLEVYDGNTLLGHVYANNNGSWGFAVEDTLTLGKHVFTVVGAGVTSAEFVLNITAPDSAKSGIDMVADSSHDLATVASSDASTAPVFAMDMHALAASDSARPAVEIAIYTAGSHNGDVGSGATIDEMRPELPGSGERGTTVEIFGNDHSVLHMVPDGAAAWQAVEAGGHGAKVSGLVLSDLLQPAAELFADEAKIPPFNDNVQTLELSNAGFGDSGHVDSQFTETTGGVSATFPTVIPAELWQQEAAHSVA